MLTPLQKRTRLAKRALAALGLREAVTWSFIAKPAAELFGGGKPELALANPIAADLSDMRPSLVPGLVAAAERNARRGFADVALFEVGQIFLGAGENDQRIAAAAPSGAASPRRAAKAAIGAAAAPVDAYRREERRAGAARRARRRRQRRADRPRRPGVPASRPLGDAAVRAEERRRLVRRTAPERAAKRSTPKGRWSPSRSSLDAIPPAKARPTKAKPKLERSEFMPVERDLAFVVAESARGGRHPQGGAGRRSRAGRGGRRVRRLSRRRRAGGQKSVAIAVTLQPRERTLTDAEIEAAIAKIVAEVGKKTGATLR